MRIKTILLLLLPFITLPAFTAVRPVPPLIIDPSVTVFDSIPQVTTDRTFYITLTTDTSTERTATGRIGSTRVRRGKMADIICEPRPAEMVKTSLEKLFAARGCKADTPEAASHTITCTILDCSLTETIKNLSQTMEADLVVEIVTIKNGDATQSMKYIFRSRNTKSTLDTSKYAAAILRGAVESVLKEITVSITR